MKSEKWFLVLSSLSTRLSNFTFTFHFHALEKEMATHSTVLAWRIPGMGEPGGLLSMELHRVGHNWSDLAAAAAAFVLVQKVQGTCYGTVKIRKYVLRARYMGFKVSFFHPLTVWLWTVINLSETFSMSEHGDNKSFPWVSKWTKSLDLMNIWGETLDRCEDSKWARSKENQLLSTQSPKSKSERS